MIDARIDELLAGDWLVAVLRVAFVALIYFFLYLVLRTTARELALVARTTGSGEASSAQAALVVVDGVESSLRAGATLALQPTTTIGRVAGSDLVVDDPHVSARHAEIRFHQGQWWLRDLGSSNGTLLNGEPVRTVVAVRHGDVLQCGRVRFRLVSSTAVPFENASA